MFAERSNISPGPIGVAHGPGIRLYYLGKHRFEFGASVGKIYPRAHAPDHPVEERAPKTLAVGGIELDRDPELDVRAGETKIGRHHAYDLAWAVIQRNRAAYDLGIAAKLRLPKAMAQNHQPASSRRLIPRLEQPS